MAVFTIKAPDGRQIQIKADDQATALRGAKEWAASNPVQKPATAASAPAARTEGDGLLANLGAGFDNGVNSVLGAPVDLPVWLGNSVINAGNSALEMAGAGRPVPNIPVDLPGSRLGWEKTQEGLGFTPASDIEAVTVPERLVRGMGDAAGQSILPETLLARGAQAVQEGARAVAPLVRQGVEALEPLFGAGTSAGRMAANTATNVAAGAGASVAADVAPDPLKPIAGLVGGIVAGTPVALATAAPAAVRTAANVAGDFLAPVTAAGQERMAGQTLRDAATSPSDVIDAIGNAPANRVPGSKPTTFQQTGDMGLGSLERAIETRSPVEFQQRRADQNSARLASLGQVQPTGAPEHVASTVRGFIQQIDDETNAAFNAATTGGAARVAQVDAQTGGTVEAARRGAQQTTAGLGQGRAPELVGDDLRGALEAARAAAKAHERALWTAVDPDGTLALPVAATKQRVRGILQDITPVSARPEGAEASIYSDLATLGDGAMPFRYVTELDSRVKTAMREERLARGESTAYRRLSQLKSAIENDLDNAVSGRVAQDRQAVQAGTMRSEDALEARLLEEVRSFASRKAETGTVSPTGLAGTSRGGSPVVPRSNGAEVQGRGGLGNAPRDPRLSPDVEPNFDAEALGRLRDARAATRTRAETFDNGTLAPIRKRPTATGQYDMGPAAVPAKIFFPGAKSVDAIATYRRAVGDQQAMATLSDYVVDRLRKMAMREDGTLDPVRVANFQRTHADALRSFPELNARFGGAANASAQVPIAEAARSQAVKDATRNADEAIAVAAQARKTRLDEAQKGALGRLMKLEDPSDVVRTVGAIFARQDAVNEMGRLRAAIGKNAQGLEGLRKSIVDYVTDRFVSNTEAAASGANQIKSDQFQSFVKSNKAALRVAGITEDELNVMQAIADDLREANRPGVKLPARSNTAQDQFAVAKAGDTPLTMMTKIAAAASTSGIGTSLVVGPWLGLPVGIATGLIGAMRQAGLSKVDDILKDAMLNPQRARLLMQKVKPQQQEQIGQVLAQQYRRAAVTAASAQGVEDEKAPRRAPEVRRSGATFPGGIAEGFQKDLRDLIDAGRSAVNSLGAPGRAIRGEYDERSIDPITGELSMLDPRMVDDAAELAGTISVSGGPMVRPANSLGMFGGIGAKTADRAALSKAEAMAANGADREAIWQETGWFQGNDGKWRFEIDDRNTMLKGEGSTGEVAKRWGSTLSGFRHPRAYEAYPEVEEIRLRGMRADTGERGQYMPPNILDDDFMPTIAVNNRLPSDEARSTILHEMQHAIQEEEGFAVGGHPSRFADVLPDPQAISDAKVMDALIRRGTPVEEAPQAFLNMVGRDVAPEARVLIQDLDALRALPADPMEAYKRLAGEVEARNVQARRDMTPEQRRSTAPWRTQDVDDSNQIIRLNT